MTGKKQHDEVSGYKYARIKTDLSIQVLEGQLRPHDRIPSLNEIAHKYKVSKITARRVLNDLVAEGLVYASRGRGSFVSDFAARSTTKVGAHKNRSLGVVFEHAAGSFMSDIIMGIDEEAFSHSVQINLCLSNNSYEREAENLERLAKQGVNRILVFMVLRMDEKALNVNIPLYLRLQEQGVRLLLIGCHLAGIQIPSITWDDYNAYRRLVQFVRQKGRRKPVYVTRVDNASTTTERLRGFKDGLLEQNLAFDASRIVLVRTPHVEGVTAAAYEQFLSFLDRERDTDAIVCSDEMVASGVFEALEERKRCLKAQPIVGGMGCMKNLHVLRGHPYALLEYETHQLGHQAAAMMLRDELPKPGESDSVLFHRVLPVQLRVPKSLK